MYIDTAGYFVYCVLFRLEDNTSGAVNSQHIRLLCVYVCTCTCYLMSVSVSTVQPRLSEHGGTGQKVRINESSDNRGAHYYS